MGVREAMALSGLHVLLTATLVSWLFSIVVDGSPLDMADMPVTLNFRDKQTGHDHEDVAADIDPLIRVHHHHIGKRDTHHELFEPRNEIVLDWRLSDGSYQSMHYEHGNTSYINLESLQEHGLLLDQRPLCAETEPNTRSNLTLDFNDLNAYETAKQAWSEPGLLFVVQDDSCHEAPKHRSVYKSETMEFDRQLLSVQIAARHLNFGPDEVESAHKVRIFISNLEQLKKRHSNSNFYVVPRVSRGLSATIKRLGHRSDDWSDSDEEPGPPDDPEPGHRDPTKKQKRHDPRGDNRSNFDDWANTGPIIIERSCPSSDNDSSSCSNGAGPGKPGPPKEDHYKEVQKAMDETFHPSANIHFSKNFDQSTGGADHARENLVDPKEVKVIPIPTINLVNSFAHVNLDFSVGLAFDIKKAGGVHEAALKRGIQDLYIMVEAKEELRVQLQAEILAKFGVDVYCALWLFPLPGKFSCVGGPMLANQQFLFPIPGLSGGPPMPINGFGFELMAGFALWMNAAITVNMNITTPGVSLKVKQGSQAGFGIKDGEPFESNWDGDLDWLKPKFHTQDLSGSLSIGIGPAFSASFGKGRGAPSPGNPSPGNPSPGNGPGSGAPAGGGGPGGSGGGGPGGGPGGGGKAVIAMEKRMPSILTGVDIFGKIALPEFVFKAGTVGDVDEKCSSPGPFQRAVQVGIDIKIGPFFGMSFGGWQLDTSNIITGSKSMSGLQWLKNLWQHCWDITNTDFGRWELGIQDGLNEDRGSLKDAGVKHYESKSVAPWPTKTGPPKGPPKQTFADNGHGQAPGPGPAPVFTNPVEGPQVTRTETWQGPFDATITTDGKVAVVTKTAPS